MLNYENILNHLAYRHYVSTSRLLGVCTEDTWTRGNIVHNFLSYQTKK